MWAVSAYELASVPQSAPARLPTTNHLKTSLDVTCW